MSITIARRSATREYPNMATWAQTHYGYSKTCLMMSFFYFAVAAILLVFPPLVMLVLGTLSGVSAPPSLWHPPSGSYVTTLGMIALSVFFLVRMRNALRPLNAPGQRVVWAVLPIGKGLTRLVTPDTAKALDKAARRVIWIEEISTRNLDQMDPGTQKVLRKLRKSVDKSMIALVELAGGGIGQDDQRFQVELESIRFGLSSAKKLAAEG